MSSNIRIKRICQHCGVEFEARTTVTRYCGDPCAKKAYKVRSQEEKVRASDAETAWVKALPIADLKAKEFLTVRDAATLLNSSRQTIYNLINAGVIRAVNIKVKKTLIKRSEIDRLFEGSAPVPRPVLEELFSL